MINFIAVTPHPPIIVPGVGKGESLKAVENTIESMQKLEKLMLEAKPKTLLLISPHAYTDARSFAINVSETLQGDLGKFASEVSLNFKNNIPFIEKLQTRCTQHNVPLVFYKGELDHGSIVPLYFLTKNFPIRLVQLSFSTRSYYEHLEYGRIIREICEEEGEDIAIVASGDLSHKISKDSHLGYSPKGKEFDEKLVELLEKGKIHEILEMDKELIKEAGECGFRSIAILLGIVQNNLKKFHILNYEAPFGVGYLVSHVELGETKKEDPNLAGACLDLAKKTVEEFINKNAKLQVPKNLPEDCYLQRKGVFVTLHKEGQLRGCIGTFLPTSPNIAQEIVNNAISACSRDFRFSPVSSEELQLLKYDVSLLDAPQSVKDIKELDPKKHGIIVSSSDGRRGLLLPNLEGIDTVEQQISIASQKGGIDLRKDSISLQSFTVVKFSDTP